MPLRVVWFFVLRQTNFVTNFETPEIWTLSTIHTLLKTGFKILCTGSEANFQPFVNALFSKWSKKFYQSMKSISQKQFNHTKDNEKLTQNIVYFFCVPFCYRFCGPLERCGAKKVYSCDVSPLTTICFRADALK